MPSTQVCTTCGSRKPLGQFSWRKKGVLRHRVCKSCSNGVAQECYRRTKPAAIRRANQRNPNFYRLGVERAYNYLKTHPCVDCGESNVLALEFDHRDGSKYKLRIADLPRYSEEKWTREVFKCDVRCGSCHNKRTAEQKNTVRFQLWAADQGH